MYVTFVIRCLTRVRQNGITATRGQSRGGNRSMHKGALHGNQVYRAVEQPVTLSAAEPAVRPAVDVSWRRCLTEFKLDPVSEYVPRVLEDARVRELQGELDELVQIARAEMDSLYEQIQGSGYALLLADTNGVILWEKIDPAMQAQFSRAGLILGAEWSERCEGTNGIGTCATEGRPITIHQADHFRSRHVNLSCSAAPIHDPQGKVIAVLDASCVKPDCARESQLHTVALVNSSARLIEKCLFLRRYRGDSMLRFHHRPELVDLLHDGAMAIGNDGSIVASDSTGLRLLGAANRADLVGRSIAEIFDTTFEEMLAASGAARRAVWELRDHRFGRRYYASLAEAQQSGARAALVPAPQARGIVHVRKEAVLGQQLTLEELAGDDPQMIRNLRNARRVADCPVPVLIHGATGTGKEMFAKALHAASRRAARPLIPVNCAAIPESLIESELFGYVAGAFTGAKREGLRGLIVQSSGGTLFLDEIGDMPVLMQSRLLRVLEEQEVTPLGSERAVKVDLRVVCASHRNLPELIRNGQFREDLYYRLNGITLELPSLADRRDKESLIRQCIARESIGGQEGSIEAVALERLISYGWPGNIRELRNAIRSALALSEDRVIRLRDLPSCIRRVPERTVPRASEIIGAAAAPAQQIEISLGAAEREALLRSIEHFGGHMTQVAAHLGISRNTLYRKIKSHGIRIARHPQKNPAGAQPAL
jgi:sigma-54 dependent transcriptional regulator, acetoin dehydrogenase operon transcriptional activator AcoR